MRGSVALACALLACRPRAGSRDERFDAGPPTVDAPVIDAAPPTREVVPAPWSVQATGGARLRVSALFCTRGTEPAPIVSFGGGWGMELVGGGNRAGARWTRPADLGVTARGDGTVINCPWEPGVAAILGRGALDVEVPLGRASPVRVDTPAGRLIVTRGRGAVSVRATGSGRQAEVEVTTFGASARFWRVNQGAWRADELAARGTARWRPAAPSLDAVLSAALREARRALDEAPTDTSRATASLWLGAAAAVMTARAPDLPPATCFDQWAALQEQTNRLVPPLAR
jgi:hypothetical protein